MTTKHLYNKVIGLAIAALTFAACSDTWDDHNNRAAEGVEEGSLWQAIQQNIDHLFDHEGSKEKHRGVSR